MKAAYKIVLGIAVVGAAAVLGAALWEGQRAPLALSITVAPDAKRGEYLIRAGGCVACHTDAQTLKDKGPILGGGRTLKTPFGAFLTPNISRDPAHGIGKWTDVEFVHAFRTGRSPAGHNYYPAFPYTSFAGADDRDLLDIKAYIVTLPAVATPNKPHALGFPYNIRFGLTFWKWRFFDRARFKRDETKSAEWNRGAYLVNHLAHCGECHTPRNGIGGLKRDLFLAGAPDIEGGTAPNITPDPETGIGKWSESAVVDVLKSGLLPDGDFVGGAMTDVVNHGTSHLTDEDLKAIAVYLKSVKPIKNKVEKKK
ncbi:MAG TPA: c-type cytochrome [Alphaproteobacteria bacterium]|jgi:mono/diheme cytochrome c family protein